MNMLPAIDTRLVLILYAVGAGWRFIQSGYGQSRKKRNNDCADNKRNYKSPPRGPGHANSITKPAAQGAAGFFKCSVLAVSYSPHL